MSGWDTFFAAEVGASAALAGLIFVSVSISLSRILASPQLPGRALQALVVLVQILIISSLMLVPGQTEARLGIEILAIGLAVWAMVAVNDLRTLRHIEAAYRRRATLRTVLSQIAALLYVVAGSAILLHGASGFFWLVPAIICSYVIAILDAWVLLVEINR